MMPSTTLSSASIFAGFLVPNRVSNLIDYEWGGVDLQNALDGLQVKIWRCFYQASWIKITDDAGITHSLIQVENVTNLSFAFSFLMRPYVTYVVNGVTFLWWYDTASGAYITTNFGTDYLTPQLALDDHREEQSAIADVIFAYVRNSMLYIRLQRDRFQIEYPLAAALSLVQIGMTENYRFAFAAKIINGFNLYFDQAIIDSRNTLGTRFDHFGLCPLQASYSLSFGNSVIQAEGLADNTYRAGFEILENTVNTNFVLNADEYDYFTAFYRIWQHKRKPFTIDAVIDGRALQRYKAHFVPNTVTMQKSGPYFNVSAQMHIINNQLDKTAIKTLAESRNDESS